MKRICFFIHNMNCPGGTERVTSVIGNKLVHHGFKVYILNLTGGEQPFYKISKNINNEKLFEKKSSGLKNLPSAVAKIRSFVKKNKIDTFISVESMLALYTIPALFGLAVHHICWEHFNYYVDLGKSSRKLARKLAAFFSDDVVTLTERDKNFWLLNNNCKANIFSISNPITIDLPEYNFHTRNNIFLAVGRLTNQKGFDLLLNAWSCIAKKHPNWLLRIIGDGEDRDILLKICNKLNIENNVEFLPKTKDISLYYQEAKYFVMSSRFEGLPLVLVEAQAFGLPVISFDCNTGPAEIIINNETGWLCEPNDIGGLSDLINNAINLSESEPDKYDILSYNASLNAKRFDIDKIIIAWEHLIRRNYENL